MAAMKSGTHKRPRRSERAHAALFAEDRRPAWLWRVHWQNYGYHGCCERGKQKDVSPFQCGFKSEIARRLALCAVRLRKEKRRATIAMATAARRVCNGNCYSAMVTNRVLPPKWISVILLPSLTNAEYFALPVSSFHCTGASATTFPLIEIVTWVSSADTA
jgi:hypothetical protein